MKDQEIIVDSPPPRESMSQSSGSTPTLPYSYGQAALPISTSSHLAIPTASFPTSVPQNVSIEHFPLVSSSSNSLYHSSLQPSSISLPDPPPYPNTILLTPLGPTLYGNPSSPIYPHTTPLFSSNPLVGSSLSFPQQNFPSKSTLNPWSFSHAIYNPQHVYTSTSYPFSSNTFPSFSTLLVNTSTTFSNTNPIFTTISNTPRSSSDSLPQRRLTKGWPRGWSRGNTYYSTRKPYSQIFDSHTSPFNNIAFSSSNAPWSGHSRYFCPDDPINLYTRPGIVNYTPLKSPLLILFLSQTFPSLKSFPQWLLSMNFLDMSEICSPLCILAISYQVVTTNLLFLFTSRSKCSLVSLKKMNSYHYTCFSWAIKIHFSFRMFQEYQMKYNYLLDLSCRAPRFH